MKALEWAYTISALTGYGIVVYFSFMYSGLLDYLFKHKPYFFAWIGFVWTVVSATALFVWSAQYNEPSSSPSASGWFHVGPSANIHLFNIPINSWWSYTIILIYQVQRGLVSSMISKIFSAYLITQIQTKNSGASISPRESWLILLGQSSSTVFTYWSSATDVFLALTQIDLTLCGMVSVIVFEAIALRKFLAGKISPNVYKELARNESNSQKMGAAFFGSLQL